MTKSDTRLEEMNLPRKPCHQKQEKAKHHRSHSEPCHRYRQMLAVELPEFVFVHVISLLFRRKMIPASSAQPRHVRVPPIP
jgi:hypothetical protein